MPVGRARWRQLLKKERRSVRQDELCCVRALPLDSHSHDLLDFFGLVRTVVSPLSLACAVLSGEKDYGASSTHKGVRVGGGC